MGRAITTEEAIIHTAAIEIKTLTIRGRQVTLSVFRQLQNEPVIDWPTMKLNGVPWGKVHYFPGKECQGEGHLHIIWQKDKELRRACVSRPGVYRLFEGERDSITATQEEYQQTMCWAFFMAALEDITRVAFTPENNAYIDGTYTIPGVGALQYRSQSFQGKDFPERCMSAVAWMVKHHREQSDPDRAERRKQELRGHVEAFFGSVDTNSRSLLEHAHTTKQNIATAKATLATRETQYRELYEQLSSLTQLFIAT